MSDPYREHILLPKEKVRKNVYKYVLRTSYNCPVCKIEVKEKVWKYGVWQNNDGYKFCHPLKRIVIKGFLWCKKYCPVDGVHHHIICNDCKVSWITMAADQSEANPDIKDAYL